MMKVTVMFFGSLVDAAGSQKNVEVSASTVSNALAELCSRFGEKFRTQLFDENGEVRRSYNFLVNNRNIRFLKQFDTELRDGDKLTILPVIGGG